MEEYIKHYRYDLDLAAHYKLEKIIKDAIASKKYNLSDEIIKKLTEPKEIKNSIKKTLAMSEAREAKSAKVQQKVKNAIEYLVRREEKVTYSSISEVAQVNRATAKKYTPEHYVKHSKQK